MRLPIARYRKSGEKWVLVAPCRLSIGQEVIVQTKFKAWVAAVKEVVSRSQKETVFLPGPKLGPAAVAGFVFEEKAKRRRARLAGVPSEVFLK